MKKQLRKFLSAFMVLTMLLSALPMAAFAEETSIPVVVDVPAAETEEPIETPTTEPTEAPAAEPTEAPAAEEPEATAAEPTEAPTVKEPEATAAEPIKAPAAEEPEAPAAEPTEVPAVKEPEATAAEPTEAPAVEEPEATAAEPIDESADEPEGDFDDPNMGIMPLSLDVDTRTNDMVMNIHVDDIIIGKSFKITWDYVASSNHYEIAVVRINKDGEETYLTSGTRNRESTDLICSYTISASDVPSDTARFRIFVCAAADPYPCDNSRLIKQSEVTVSVSSEESSKMAVSIKVWRDEYSDVSWEKVQGADYYLYSVRDITTGSPIYDREKTEIKKFSIDCDDVVSGHRYRVWVGAYDSEDNLLASHQTETILRLDCNHSVTFERDTKAKYYYDDITDTHHMRYKWYDIVCSSCGEILDSRSEYDEEEEHNFNSNGICVYCGYAGSDCRHTSVSKAYTSTKYESEGKDTHTMIEYFDVVCDGCGAVIPLNKAGDTFGYREDRTKSLKHNFVKGTCKDCGYIKADELTVTVQRKQSSANVGETIAADASIAGGSGTYQIYWKVYCGDECVSTDATGAWITAKELSASYTADRAGKWYFEAGVLDSDNETASATTQAITVTEDECEHDYQKIKQTNLTEYENSNDSQHRIIYHYASVCSLCGDVKGTWTSDEFEPHSFDDEGKCVCGAFEETDPDCEHEWNSEVSEVKVEQTIRNDRMERHMVTTVYADVCGKCGSKRSHEAVEYVAHVFGKNGKCECGYIEVTDECDHATTGVQEGKPVYELHDDDYHRVTTYERHKCACGQVNYVKEVSSLQAHVYEGRKCKNCGFEQACDHSTTQTVIATSKPVKKDKNNHTVTETYQETCLCGKINNTGTRMVDQPHSWGSLQISSTHVDGRGHRCYYKCACGEEKDNGYTSFVKNYAENNKCAACRARYDLIKELQTLLIKRGYSVGKSGVDGVFGNATKEAMNAFRKDVMGLSAINDVDEATMAALRGGDVLPTPESTDAPEATPAPVEAMEVLEALLKNEQMSDDLFNQLIRKASDYLNDGKITREQYEQFCYSVAKEHNFECVFGLETDNIQYVINPEKGSTVGAKVLSKDIGDKLTDFVGSAVFDSYSSALDPFYEEFGQTMDVFATEFKTDTKKWDDIDFLNKIKLNNMIEDVLKKAYGEEVAKEVLEGKKKIDSLSKDWNSMEKAFTKQELAEAEKLFKAFYGEDKYFVMSTYALDIETGEVKLVEKLIDVKTYINGEMASIKQKQKTLESWLGNYFDSGELSITKTVKDKEKETKRTERITSTDVDKFMKNLNGVLDALNNGADFYKLLASRMTLDREKVIDFCDTLDNCEGLTDELNAARKLLRAEVSENEIERWGAILAEYAMKLAVNEVGKAAVDAVETATGAAANPVYAAMKASAAACNMTMGIKGVVSNTRGMTAQYENYEAMYQNYLRLRKRYEDNPTNSQMREDARNALTYALLCNVKADEYYLEMVKSAENSFAANIAEVITGNKYTGLDKINELKGMINTEISNRKAQLELLKDGRITSDLGTPKRIEFTAYEWSRFFDMELLGAGDRLIDSSEVIENTYMFRHENSTQFAVDGLYESVQSFFSAQTEDGDVREFVVLKSSTGRNFIITKSTYDFVKQSNGIS